MNKYKRFIFISLGCVMMFLLNGCGVADNENRSSITNEQKSNDFATSQNFNTTKKASSDEIKIFENLDMPNKATAIAAFREAMGNKASELSNEQVQQFIETFKQLTLNSYNMNEVDVEKPAGGGIVIRFYYNEMNFSINFVSKDIIEYSVENQDEVYLRDTSANYNKIEKLILSFINE